MVHLVITCTHVVGAHFIPKDQYGWVNAVFAVYIPSLLLTAVGNALTVLEMVVRFVLFSETVTLTLTLRSLFQVAKHQPAYIDIKNSSGEIVRIPT